MKDRRTNVVESRDDNFKHFKSTGIDSKESILQHICSLAGRYDNPIPTRLLAPIICSKLTTQNAYQKVCNKNTGRYKKGGVPYIDRNILEEKDLNEK